MFKNTMKTTVLLAGLGGLIVAVAGIMVGGSYWFSDKLALRSAKAQIVTEAEAPEFHAMIRRLSERAGMPMPTVAIATAISFMAQMTIYSSMFGGRRDDRNGNPLMMLAAAILAPIAASLIQMAVSRSREFEADRGAADLLGTGVPLASALRRIDAIAEQRPMAVQPAQASMYIHNPLAEARSSNAGMARMFSTHPSTEDRIARLLEMSPAR